MALLLEQQDKYDERKFDQASWELVGNWRVQKTRHIGHHLGMTALILLDGDRRRIETEVVPALSMHRAQLINLHGLDPDQYGEVAHRLPNDGAVERKLLYVNGRISHYIHDVEHGNNADRARLQRVGDAVASLHIATESLAHIHGVDAEVAHLARLQQLMGEDAPLLEER